jgi:predicted Zn-dependent peptidase
MVKFYHKKLKNGITVLFEKREVPVVACSITNRYGAGYEGDSTKGIAHFIEHLVFTGTKNRTHEDISREVEKKGGVLNAFTSHEATCFLFKLPSEHIFRGFDILVDILKNPTFDPAKFEKEKKVILEEIKMHHDVPERAVFDLLFEKMYKKPFGGLITGNSQTISPLTRDEVYQMFKEQYSPEHFIVTLVGNADFTKVCSYLEKAFVKGKRKLNWPLVVKQQGEIIEERAGIDQAHFVFGMHAPLSNEDDFYALEILDAYLASGMSSRLFLKIREELGLAYSVQSALNSEQHYSYYAIYSGTSKENIPQIKKIIIDELKAVEKMKQSDLDDARERILGLRKISSEESLKVMQELLFAELSGNAGEYYSREKKYLRVSLSQIKKVAKNLLFSYSSAAIVPK